MLIIIYFLLKYKSYYSWDCKSSHSYCKTNCH